MFAPVPEPPALTAPMEAAEKLPRSGEPGAVLVGAQSTFVGQALFRFRSPYQGRNSFRSANEFRQTDTYTLILGVRPLRNLELFLNPELTRGQGVGRGMGLAGYVNGDLIQRPDGAEKPYFSRYYAHYTVPLSGETQHVDAAENVLPDEVPVRRLEFYAGGISPADLFDFNTFATNPRTQFLNLAMINAAAYDYAEDARGYTEGVAVSWTERGRTLRAGSFRMPRRPGSLQLSTDLVRNRSDQLELELNPKLLPGDAGRSTLRLMGYRNVGRMGRFADALLFSRRNGGRPDTAAVRADGAAKYGLVLGFEQPLAAEGNTGVFARYGWNDGRRETCCYTEADRSLLVGGQLSGVCWGRKRDSIGAAFALNELSSVHQKYLRRGGMGFSVGDGRLDYGREQVLEVYYNYQLSSLFSVTLDYQRIGRPGYNRDRGPASVMAIRFHLQY